MTRTTARTAALLALSAVLGAGCFDHAVPAGRDVTARTPAEAEALRDTIKQQMLAADTETLEAGAYIVRWTSVLTQRFDSTAFKREHSELYKEFTKQTASRRFSISA